MYLILKRDHLLILFLCLDISGSMGTDAPVKGNDGFSMSYGISVLSLTISAAKTILKTLNDKDNITIVTYSTEANILFTDCEWYLNKINKILKQN